MGGSGTTAAFTIAALNPQLQGSLLEETQSNEEPTLIAGAGGAVTKCCFRTWLISHHQSSTTVTRCEMRIFFNALTLATFLQRSPFVKIEFSFLNRNLMVGSAFDVQFTKGPAPRHSGLGSLKLTSPDNGDYHEKCYVHRCRHNVAGRQREPRYGASG
jgi:hypothetical protein